MEMGTGMGTRMVRVQEWGQNREGDKDRDWIVTRTCLGQGQTPAPA